MKVSSFCNVLIIYIKGVFENLGPLCKDLKKDALFVNILSALLLSIHETTAWNCFKQMINTNCVQSNPTITDLKGLTIFFCFCWTYVIANLWSKKTHIHGTKKNYFHYRQNYITKRSGIAGCDCTILPISTTTP